MKNYFVEMKALAGYNNNYRDWLVCIDIYSCSVFLKLLTNKKADYVAKKIKENY